MLWSFLGGFGAAVAVFALACSTLLYSQKPALQHNLRETAVGNHALQLDLEESSSEVDYDRICPKVYLYDIHFSLEAMNPFRGQSDNMTRPFGDRIEFMGKGYYDTKQKSLCSIFHRQLIDYGDLCLTANPSEADLFYIPWYRDWYCGIRPCDWSDKTSPEERTMFELMRNETMAIDGVDYFARNKGADHLLVNCCDYVHNFVPKDAKWRLNEYKYLISVGSVGNPTILAPFVTQFHIDSEVTRDDLPWIQSHLKEKPIWSDNFRWKKLGPEESTNSSFNVVHHMPPVYHQRKYLASFAVGDLMGKRNTLFHQCQNAKEEICRVVRTDRGFMIISKDGDPSKKPSPVELLEKKLQTWKAIKEAYQTSVFCFQPTGDNCTRKGIMDGWLNGCIPVVFNQCSVELYRDFLDTTKAMVFMGEEVVSRARVIEYLRNIPRHTVREMQLYIVSVAHRLQISKIPSLDSFHSLSAEMMSLVQEDAFFRILRIAKQSFDLWKDCERKLDGHYQPIYRVCCERSNDCHPIGILAEGYINDCEVKGSVPCAYDISLPYHVEVENPEFAFSEKDELPWGEEGYKNGEADPVSWGDFLREPIPYEWNEVRARSWDAFW